MATQDSNQNSIVPTNKEERLEELKKRFRSETGIQPTSAQSENDDPLANVKIDSEVRSRTFDDLSLADQRKVIELIEHIDYRKSSDIQTYGSVKDSPMSKNAEKIISKYTAGDVGDISTPLTQLVATLKTNNPQDVSIKVSSKDKDGFFANIRDAMSFKKAKKRLAIKLAEHQTIRQNIQAVEVQLEKQKADIGTDIAIYEQMSESTFQMITDLELVCIGLQLMIKDAQQKRDEIVQKANETGSLNPLEAQEAQELKNAIDRMERKLYSIQTVRTSTIQTLPQLAALVTGDEIICEKIDEVKTLVIPMWEWQYAIAVGAVKQLEALHIQKSVRGITSKLLTGNAELVHDNMIVAQEELYAAAVAIEDLQIVQGYIDDMVVRVEETRKDTAQKHVDGLKEMQEIERKNANLMRNSTK